MNRFAHHASSRSAEVEAEFAHARYIAVPALLFVLGMVVALSIAALQGGTEGAPTQEVTTGQGPIVPFGA